MKPDPSRDRELLANAAKAYFDGAPKHIGEGVLDWVRDCVGPFSPLTDDGDALRLAVKLDIEIYQGVNDGAPCSIAGYPHGRIRYVIEPHDGDKDAATRRAVVRAAAAIGKEMP